MRFCSQYQAQACLSTDGSLNFEALKKDLDDLRRPREDLLGISRYLDNLADVA
jgi:hypothetical protein